MLRNLKTLGFVALIVAGAGTAAEAGWRHHGGGGSWGSSGGYYGSSGGSYGSWGSSGGSWGSSGGSSGGSWGGYVSYGSSGGWGSSGGSWGGHHHRHRHHHAYYGSWGSSGGSSGGYSYGSSGGSSGGSHGGVIIDSAPVDVAPPAGGTAPAPAAPADPEAGSTTYRTLGTQGMLSVAVPANAKVFVNGLATTSTGANRQFVSRGLKAGSNYNYEVRAEIVRDGQTVSETKTVQLTAGENLQLAFNFADTDDQSADAAVATTLTVNVPADAKLFLAGKETKSIGEIRQFTTHQLAAGAEWNAYTIRAEIQRDGRTITKEQTITLGAGQDRDITLEFDSADVAGQVAGGVSR